MPSREVVLQTIDGDHFLFKTDILAGLVTYSTDKRLAANLVTITAQRALEIVEMNRRGEKPDSLSDSDEPMTENHQVDLLAGESLTRFDKAKKRRSRSRVATRRTTRRLRQQTPTTNSLQTTSRLLPRTGSSAEQKASSNVRRTSHSSNARRASRNSAKRVNNSSALITSHSVTPNLSALMPMATNRNHRTTDRDSADLSSRGMVETETADSVVVRENLTLPNSRSRRKPMTAATSKITTTQICTSDTPYYI